MRVRPLATEYQLANCNVWLNELETLSVRFSHLGVSADLGSLTLAEAWAVLQYLRLMALLHGAT